jgi:ABC-type transporter Mla subunit MlaD
MPSPSPDIGDDTGIPRWVKIFGVIALIVVLLVVILMLTGVGIGGPGGHTPPEGGH